MSGGVTPPVLIMGMHRSGTSVVTRMLDLMGFFVGRRVDENHEAFFFRRLNEWLVRQAGGSWDTPDVFDWYTTAPELRSLTRAYIDWFLRSPRAIQYWGFSRTRDWLAGGSRSPWGWKDPRNTVTWPIWRDVFPGARVIILVRHGVDVAASLQTRYQRQVTGSRERFRKHPLRYWVRQKRTGFANTARCATLSGGLRLWQEYVERGARISGDDSIPSRTLKYEDLVSDPAGHLSDLAEFLSLTVPRAQILEIAEMVDPSRVFRYRDDVRLLRFAEEHESSLRIHGYGAKGYG